MADVVERAVWPESPPSPCRRRFLRRCALGAAGLAATWLLAACGEGEGGGESEGEGEGGGRELPGGEGEGDLPGGEGGEDGEHGGG